MSEDTHYRVMRLLETHPDITQRELADRLGVSLGKANYCLKALVDKGWVKACNFRNSDNKWAYIYLLTPSGIEHKGRIAARFLRRKLAEFEALKAEIDLLEQETRLAVTEADS